MHNGTLTSASQPLESRLRVFGGNVDVVNLSAGRNFKGYGSFKYKALPTVEVYGGRLRATTKCHLGCDQGGDTIVRVFGGTFESSADLCEFGNKEGQSTNLVEIVDGALFLAKEIEMGMSGALTETTIAASRGGILSATRIYASTGSSRIIFDDGVLKPKYVSKLSLIEASVDSVQLTGGGVTIDIDTADRTAQIDASIVNAPVLQGGMDGGITLIGKSDARLDLGGVNSYKGPTTIANGTLIVRGTLPSATTLKLLPGTAFALTNSLKSVAVKSLELGSDALAAPVSLYTAVAVGSASLLSATESLSVGTNTKLNLYLIDHGTFDAPEVAGTFTFLKVPTSSAIALDRIKLANPISGNNYTLAADVVGSDTLYSVTVTTGSGSGDAWINANGGSWQDQANWSGGVPPNGSQASATFATEAKAGGATVNLSAPVTVKEVSVSSSEPYTFSGQAFTFDGGAWGAAWNTAVGAHQIAADINLASGVDITALEGAAQQISGNIAGTGPLSVNTAVGSGGGSVELAGNLTFSGGLQTGCGTTTLEKRPAGILTLGPGTLHVTDSASAVWDGFVVDPGYRLASILRHEGEIEVGAPIQTLSGGLIKSGPGILRLTGAGTYDIGVDHLKLPLNYGGLPLNGDSPANGVTTFVIADGKVVMGAPDQVVNVGYQLYIGWRNSNEPGAATTGELEVNGGKLNVASSLYVGFANGDPVSAPTPMHPRLTINGGEVNAMDLRVGYDDRSVNKSYYDSQEMHNSHAEFVMNGGVLSLTSSLFPTYHAGVGSTNYFTLNGGEIYAQNIYFGLSVNDVGPSAPCVFTMNGGTVILGEDLRTGRNVAPSFVNLNGGVMRAWNLTRAANGDVSEFFVDGFTLQPTYTGQAVGYRTLSLHTAFTIGEGGFIIDTTYWPADKNYAYEISQAMQHDPALDSTPDGGIIKRGVNGMLQFNPLTGGARYAFTGPVTVEEGVLGIERNALYENHVVVHKGATLRLLNKDTPQIVDSLTLANAGDGDAAILDMSFGTQTLLHQPLIISNTLNVAGNVIVDAYKFASKQPAMPYGSYPVLIYPVGQTLNPANFRPAAYWPADQVSFSETTLTSGAYSGWQALVMTVVEPTPVWSSTLNGGNWSDGANWVGAAAPFDTIPGVAVEFQPATAVGVPVNLSSDVTLAQLNLAANDSANGYALTGGSIGFEVLGTNSMLLSVPTGKHSIATALRVDEAVTLDTSIGSELALTGEVTGSAILGINKSGAGGGITTISDSATIAATTFLQSGTLISETFNFPGGLQLGPGTMIYTGPDVVTDVNIEVKPKSARLAIFRSDADVTLTGTFTATSGGFVKGGSGILRIAGQGAQVLSVNNSSTRWNETTLWPANGDSPIPEEHTGFSGLLVDEGLVVIGGPDQSITVGGPLWVGSSYRGWNPDVDTATLNILGGEIRLKSDLSIGRNFKRTLHESTYATVNLYGGTLSCTELIMAIDKTTGAQTHSVKAVLNIFGGEMSVSNILRLGHITGSAVNPAHATINIYGGTLRHKTTATKNGIQFGYLGSKTDATANRSCDGTLNIYGGALYESDRILMGQNKTVSRLELHGGLVQAENIVFNADYHAGGSAIVLFNGGVFQPLGSNVNYRTFENMTSATVSTNGAIFDTSCLAAGSYTIKQTLLHDAQLGSTLDGGLTKRGSAELVVARPNDFTGPVVVESGTLRATIDGAVPGELKVAADALFDSDATSHTISSVSGAGACVNGAVRVTGSVAPEGVLTFDDLNFAAGATHIFGDNNIIKVEGNLTAEGGGFVDFGRTDANPLPIPSSIVVMEYNTCGADFAGWKATGTGQADGKVAMRLVRDESGLVNVVRAELVYGGTLLMLR